ncbi:MAG: phosphoribosylglycinamide formyltransferase [Bacteroidota bacterium]
MLGVAVFVSGRGSNFVSLLGSIEKKEISAVIKCLITDNSSCAAVDVAVQRGIPVYFLSRTEREGYYTYDQLNALLSDLGIGLIVLAGFLKKIPDEVVDSFSDRIINIHPALLPSFGGCGMYGMNVHRAVYNSTAKVSGATVHFVDKIYDNGKIIAQSVVDISDVKSPEEIAGRVLLAEHKLLPYVVKKYSEDKIVIRDGRVIILE